MEELKPLSIYDLMLGNMVYGIYVDVDEEQTSAYLCKIIGLDSLGWAEYPIMVEAVDDFGGFYYDWFEGIPLNHDRLVRLGFKITPTNIYIKDSVWIYYDFEELTFTNDIGLRLNFVHEVQNYYRGLTGKNLEYSLV